jgi:hypothetical protein
MITPFAVVVGTAGPLQVRIQAETAIVIRKRLAWSEAISGVGKIGVQRLGSSRCSGAAVDRVGLYTN